MKLQTVDGFLMDPDALESFYRICRNRFESDKSDVYWFPTKFSLFWKWVKGMQTYYELANILNKKVPIRDNIFFRIPENEIDEEYGHAIVGGNNIVRYFANTEETLLSLTEEHVENQIFLYHRPLMHTFNKNYFISPISTQAAFEEAKDFIVQYITSYYLYIVKRDIETVETNHILASMLLDAANYGDPNIVAFALYRKKMPHELQSLMFIYKPNINEIGTTKVMAFLHLVPKDHLFNFSFFTKGTVQSDIETYMVLSILTKMKYALRQISGISSTVFNGIGTYKK